MATKQKPAEDAGAAAEAERLAAEAKAREDAETERLAAEAKAREDAETERLAAEAKAREDAETERLAAEAKAREDADTARLEAVTRLQVLRIRALSPLEVDQVSIAPGEEAEIRLELVRDLLACGAAELAVD